MGKNCALFGRFRGNIAYLESERYAVHNLILVFAARSTPLAQHATIISSFIFVGSLPT
jgi:hypothetical protein